MCEIFCAYHSLFILYNYLQRIAAIDDEQYVFEGELQRVTAERNKFVDLRKELINAFEQILISQEKRLIQKYGLDDPEKMAGTQDPDPADSEPDRDSEQQQQQQQEEEAGEKREEEERKREDEEERREKSAPTSPSSLTVSGRSVTGRSRDVFS